MCDSGQKANWLQQKEKNLNCPCFRICVVIFFLEVQINMANNMANVQQHPQEVHISHHARNGLDELFNAVISPANNSRIPQPVPMRQRNLPASFFRPPSASSSASHSRESSLDATSPFSPKSNNNNSAKPPTPIAVNSPMSPSSPVGGKVGNQQGNCNLINVQHPPTNLTIIHSRARSLPTSLQQINQLNVSNVVPSSDDNKNNPVTLHHQQMKISPHNQPNIQHGRQHSYDINNLPLPDGWGVSYTPNGERYFLNHKLKITTWEDPRKMVHMSAFGQLAQQSASSQVPSYSSQPNIQQVMNQDQQLAQSKFNSSTMSLPDGWEQASTVNGDVYYINHNGQTTTWCNPSLPKQLQAKDMHQKQLTSGMPPPYRFSTQTSNSKTNNFKLSNGNIPQELMVALENMNTSGQNNNKVQIMNESRMQTPQIHENQNILNLQLERDMLRQRQMEIKQNLLFKNTLPSLNQSTDPFLSSTGFSHGRQDNVDSNTLARNHLTLNNCALNNNDNSMLTGILHCITGIFTNKLFINPFFFSLETDFNQNLTDCSNMIAQGNPVDDMTFDTLPLDNIDSELDMDLLDNVEDLLNSNKDNIMTWL